MGRFHVQDFACFVQRQSVGSICAGASDVPFLHFSGIFGAGRGLLVGFCEGAAEDSGAGYDEGCDDAVSL